MARKQKSFLAFIMNTAAFYSSPVNFFDLTHTFCLYGFAPLLILKGFSMEPRPSIIDLINIIE